MKTLACLALAVGALTGPVLSFAQTTAPVTRAEVRADLIRLEQAGYYPSAGEDVDYPADVQAAEAKVSAAEQQRLQSSSDAVGGAPMGTSAAGAKLRPPKPAPSACVGPASFCDIYFGS